MSVSWDDSWGVWTKKQKWERATPLDLFCEIFSKDWSLSQKDTLGNEVLHYLAKYGKSDTLKAAILMGANTRAYGFDNKVPIHSAAANTNEQIMNFLCKKDRSLVNAKTFIEENTPLILAIRENSNPQVIAVLLENGANPWIKNARGMNSFDIISDSVEKRQEKLDILKRYIAHHIEECSKLVCVATHHTVSLNDTQNQHS